MRQRLAACAAASAASRRAWASASAPLLKARHRSTALPDRAHQAGAARDAEASSADWLHLGDRHHAAVLVLENVAVVDELADDIRIAEIDEDFDLPGGTPRAETAR